MILKLMDTEYLISTFSMFREIKATKRTKGGKNHQKLPHRFEKQIREPLKMKIYSN